MSIYEKFYFQILYVFVNSHRDQRNELFLQNRFFFFFSFFQRNRFSQEEIQEDAMKTSKTAISDGSTILASSVSKTNMAR